MKHKFTVLGLMVAALVFTCGCGIVNTFLGGKSAGTVSELWADVPRMDGMTKSDLDFPLAARLALQAVMQGRMDFIAYTTSASPQAVFEFYSKERMAGQGWVSQDGTGCFGNSDTTDEATICVYTKDTNGKNEYLAIVAANDTESNQTAIFFARVDASDAATAQPNN